MRPRFKGPVRSCAAATGALLIGCSGMVEPSMNAANDCASPAGEVRLVRALLIRRLREGSAVMTSADRQARTLHLPPALTNDGRVPRGRLASGRRWGGWPRVRPVAAQQVPVWALTLPATLRPVTTPPVLSTRTSTQFSPGWNKVWSLTSTWNAGNCDAGAGVVAAPATIVPSRNTPCERSSKGSTTNAHRPRPRPATPARSESARGGRPGRQRHGGARTSATRPEPSLRSPLRGPRRGACRTAVRCAVALDPRGRATLN